VTLRNYHGIEIYNSGAGAPGITIEKAAALLGVSTGTVRRMIRAGII
jgi:transposase